LFIPVRVINVYNNKILIADFLKKESVPVTDNLDFFQLLVKIKDTNHSFFFSFADIWWRCCLYS